jgi:hypothetical protein
MLSCFGHRIVASPDEYLVIKYLDGRVEHVHGPTFLQRDRFSHAEIKVVPHTRYVASEWEAIDVVHLDGRFERQLGPCHLTFDPLRHSTAKVERLQRTVASQAQYLVVQYQDGRKEHLRGPRDMCFHPLEHESIEVLEAVKLAANEAIVVYRRHTPSAPSAGGPLLTAKLQVVPTNNGTPVGEAGPPLLTTERTGEEGAVHVERRVVHGPAIFMPESNEWLHTFSWHGSVKDGKGSKTGYAGDVKVPHALTFQIIRSMPDQVRLPSASLALPRLPSPSRSSARCAARSTCRCATCAPPTTPT